VSAGIFFLTESTLSAQPICIGAACIAHVKRAGELVGVAETEFVQEILVAVEMPCAEMEVRLADDRRVVTSFVSNTLHMVLHRRRNGSRVGPHPVFSGIQAGHHRRACRATQRSVGMAVAKDDALLGQPGQRGRLNMVEPRRGYAVRAVLISKKVDNIRLVERTSRRLLCRRNRGCRTGVIGRFRCVTTSS